MALQTITPKHQHLRQISIPMAYYRSAVAGPGPNVRQTIGEANFEQWLNLDRLLVQLWESHSIRPKVVCTAGHDVEDFIGSLLPEIMRRGVVDVDPVERPLVYVW
jgi:hypothetical protein